MRDFSAYEIRIDGISREDDLYELAGMIRGEALIEVIERSAAEIFLFRLDYGFLARSLVRSHKGLFYEHRASVPERRLVQVEIGAGNSSLLGGLAHLTVESTRRIFLSGGLPSQNALVLHQSAEIHNEEYLLKLMEFRAGTEGRCWIDYPRLVRSVCGEGALVAKLGGDLAGNFLNLNIFCARARDEAMGRMAQDVADNLQGHRE